MKIEEIDFYIDKLDWNYPQEENELAINKLVDIDNNYMDMLLQPRCIKCYWDNAATVLKKIGYPRIEPIIPGLLEWLQDLNWPGAQTVVDIFRDIDNDVLKPYIRDALIRADDEDDEMWIYWLKYLIEEIGISEDEFINEKIVMILESVEE